MSEFDFQCPHCKKTVTLWMKVTGVKAPDEPKQTYLPASDVEDALAEYHNDLEFIPTSGKLIVKLLAYVKKDTFIAVNKIVKAHGGQYFPSGGKEAGHWEVPT
jgi:hypothetical protein